VDRSPQAAKRIVIPSSNISPKTDCFPSHWTADPVGALSTE
jgi:hypothetical protein